MAHFVVISVNLMISDSFFFFTFSNYPSFSCQQLMGNSSGFPNLTQPITISSLHPPTSSEDFFYARRPPDEPPLKPPIDNNDNSGIVDSESFYYANRPPDEPLDNNDNEDSFGRICIAYDYSNNNQEESDIQMEESGLL